MPVAKKRTTKKVAKKRPAKKATARKPAKRKTAKRATARKTTARKTTARKTVKKKVAKKATTRRTTARKAAPKRTAKKTVKKKTARAKRKPNPAFMRPMTPSAALGAVVGAKAIPRTEVTKKLWAYIKKNKLQDSVNRRMINADDKLKKVFGGKSKVDMFQMTKLVSKHLK